MELGRSAERAQRGVVALAHRLELAGAGEFGVGGGPPAWSHGIGPDPVDALAANVEQSDLLRPAIPFVRTGGIGIAVELPQVDRERPPRLSAVHMHVDSPAVRDQTELAHRQPNAAHVGGVGQCQNTSPRCEGAAKRLDQVFRAGGIGGNRHGPHRESAAAGPHGPGDVVGGMILVPDHHFLIRAEIQSVVDDVVRLARVANQCDLVGGDPKLAGHQLPRGFSVPVESSAVLE